jgi:hypothetical protein
MGNVIENASDGAIDAFPDAHAGVFAGNISIIGNIIRNWRTGPALTIGSQDPKNEGTVSKVLVQGNQFSTDLKVCGSSGGAAAAMRIWSGKRILIADNFFEMLNSSGPSDIVTFEGSGESGGSANYTDDVRFLGNAAYSTGNGARLWRFETAASLMTSRLEFISNRVDGALPFSFARSQGSAPIYLLNTPAAGLDTTKLRPLDGR